MIICLKAVDFRTSLGVSKFVRAGDMGEGGCHGGFVVFLVTNIVSLMLWLMYLLIKCSK